MQRVIAGRFRLIEIAGVGGMGHVYRADDALTGLRVALKLMSKKDADPTRFLEEAAILAQLAHPRVVRHVAHGFAESGEPYLAMEWLEGEDLGARLARAGLSVRETLAIARRAAEALAGIHARGVVHRDLKPSNLFLEARDPDRLKLLDFGVARALERARALTRTNATVGTAGYVAPEQAKGGRTVDARADVFSLGCVLFECLTGQPAFAGDHAIAVLAKVLMEDAPRPSSLRAEVPPALDALIVSMLAKDPEHRPVDGAAVLARLEGLGEIDLGASAPPPRPPRALSDSEQRLLSVLLVDTARTMVDGTLTEQTDEAQATPIRTVAKRFGGDVLHLAGGIALIRLEGPGGAADRASRAAHCALALAGALPDASIALATGSAEATDTFPVGPVIDRAVALLRAALGVAGVRIDDSTEALLGGRFEVLRDEGVRWLAGRRESEDGARMLLGRPTPCVGRDRELALLEATYRECIETPLARAVLVTAPPGTGKSRLRHELVSRLRAEGTARVLFARAESVAAGSSFALARELVRGAAGLREGDRADAQHAAIRALARVVPDEDRERVAEILGELAGAPTLGEPSAALRAARADARVLGDAVQRALVEWLDAECAAQPVAVVVEDLHWGDLFTVLSLGDALRRLRERPLFVLALARPEIHETFPALWSSAGVQEIRLGGLTRRASEALARAVLDDAVAPAMLARVVALADGNAFYLEELLRRVAEGQGEGALPDTVLAMAQSRLAQLDPDARRVLRAASVLGERFRIAGVAALLADETSSAVEQILHALVRSEILERGSAPGELAFRHALLRDASYAMLTESDRRTGHRLAAEHAIASGDRDPLLIASHFEKGDDPARAAPWLVAAAEAAFAGTDMRATLDLAGRASAVGAEGATLGTVRALEAIACTGLSDHERGHAAASSALGLLPPGGDAWFLAAASQVLLAAYSGRADAVMEVLMKIMQLPIGSTPPSRSQGLAMLMLCSGCYTAGQPAIGRMLLARAQGVARAHAEDLLYRGWLGNAESTRAYEGDLGSAWRGTDLAARELGAADDVLGHAFGLVLRGVVEIESGAWARAVETLRAAMTVTASSSAMFVREWNHVYLGRALGLLGRRDEALAALAPVRDVRELNKRLRAAVFAAEATLIVGDVARAESEVDALRPLAEGLPGIRIGIAAVRARAALARSAAAEAIVIADEAIPLAESTQPYPLDASFLHAARVEALARLGDARHDAARVVAGDRARTIARSLEGHDALRAAYEAIDAHARVLA